jgi:hypothetical protein
MVAGYLIELSKLGETTELASFLDDNRFAQCVEVSIADDGVAERSSWTPLQPACSKGKPIIIGRKQSNVFAACIIFLISINKTTSEFSVCYGRYVELYVADLRTNSKQVLPWIPPWALISSGHGYNVPYIHYRQLRSMLSFRERSR